MRDPPDTVKKLNEASEVLLTVDIWSNRQMRSYIDVTAHSFQIKSCTMLCWLADDRNPQLEDTVSNFELLTNKVSVLLNESSSLRDAFFI